MILLLHFLALVLLLRSVGGQNFTVPSSWRKPSSSLTRESREELSGSVIKSLVQLLNSTGQISTLLFSQSASFMCALPLSDLISGTTSYQTTVANALNAAFASEGVDMYSFEPLNSDPVLWGIAAIDSYRAYNDTSLLQKADSLWQEVSQFQISPQDVAAGSHPNRSVPIPLQCSGSSVAGGVFWLPDTPTNMQVNGETVGAFLALSAHLFEATNNTKYMSAAQLAAQFIQLHLYNGTIILDTFDIGTCSLSTGTSATYNSGFVIEGLSVLASKNSTWNPFLLNLIETSIPFPGWTNSDGVIYEGPASNAPSANDVFTTFKGIFIRGLYEAWSRQPMNSDVATLIQSYITVQFNALLDLASTPQRNQYSPQWEGPPVEQLMPWGQLAALDVLNSVVGFAPTPNSENVSSSSSPTSTGSSVSTTPSAAIQGNSRQTSKIPIIVGVVLGGAGFILIVFIILFSFMRRRQRQRRDISTFEIQTEETSSQYGVRPYPSTMSYLSIESSTRPITASNTDVAAISSSIAGVGTNIPFDDNRRLSGLNKANTVSNSGDNTNGIHEPKRNADTLPFVELDAQRGGGSDTDLVGVPRMILNQILARLAQPEGRLEDEELPRYES